MESCWMRGSCQTAAKKKTPPRASGKSSVQEQEAQPEQLLPSRVYSRFRTTAPPPFVSLKAPRRKDGGVNDKLIWLTPPFFLRAGS